VLILIQAYLLKYVMSLHACLASAHLQSLVCVLLCLQPPPSPPPCAPCAPNNKPGKPLTATARITTTQNTAIELTIDP
jgi:hypothetical protein